MTSPRRGPIAKGRGASRCGKSPDGFAVPGEVLSKKKRSTSRRLSMEKSVSYPNSFNACATATAASLASAIIVGSDDAAMGDPLISDTALGAFQFAAIDP